MSWALHWYSAFFVTSRISASLCLEITLFSFGFEYASQKSFSDFWNPICSFKENAKSLQWRTKGLIKVGSWISVEGASFGSFSMLSSGAAKPYEWFKDKFWRKSTFSRFLKEIVNHLLLTPKIHLPQCVVFYYHLKSNTYSLNNKKWRFLFFSNVVDTNIVKLY